MRNGDVVLYQAPTLYDAVVPPGPCEGFYRGIAERTGGPVLELACGTGRLAVPLAEDGHEVVALDISAAMLRAARAKARGRDVEIEFIKADIRSFELARRFALIVVSCNSLSHFTTNDELVGALRRAARHLAPGGLIAFDILNPRIADLVLLDRSEVRHRVLGEPPAMTATEEVLAYDPISQIRVLRWHLNGENAQSRHTETMRLRTIFPQELPLVLAAAGLELVRRFGDFEGRPLTADSLNQVCLARQLS